MTTPTVLVAVINGDMIGTPTAPGEYVHWSQPDVRSEPEWDDLLGQPVAEYAASNPHMIVWEVAA